MTAHPAPDTRIELLDSLTMNGIPTAPPRSWARIVEAMEAAGLVVLDPSSDELKARLRLAISDPGAFTDCWGGYGVMQDESESVTAWQARAVLSALAAPGGEPS